MSWRESTRPRIIYHALNTAGEVVYVGATVDIEQRRKGHEHTAKKYYGSRFERWVRDELAAGRSLKLVKVRNAGDDWRKTEREEINRQLAGGAKLLNAAIRIARPELFNIKK